MINFNLLTEVFDRLLKEGMPSDLAFSIEIRRFIIELLNESVNIEYFKWSISGDKMHIKCQFRSEVMSGHIFTLNHTTDIDSSRVNMRAYCVQVSKCIAEKLGQDPKMIDPNNKFKPYGNPNARLGIRKH